MYKKSVPGWRKHLDFILIDIFCLHIAFIAAYFVRHGNFNLYVDKSYLHIVVVLTVLDVLVAILCASFKNVLKRGYFKEFVAALQHVLIVELSVCFYLFSMQMGITYSRTVFYIFPVIYVFLTTAARYIWKNMLCRRREGEGSSKCLLITNREMASEVVENLQKGNYSMMAVQGIALVDTNIAGEEISGVPVVAGVNDIVDYARSEWVDAVLIALPQNMTYPVRLAEDFQKMGIVVHRVLAKKDEMTECRQQVERIGDYTVLTTSMNYASSERLFMKRMLDILGGLVGCLITGLLTVIVGPIIYFSSPGPIFFTQTRVGRNGRQFKIYKFRTMYMDAEARKAELMAENRVKDGFMFKLDYDPRIIGNKKLPDGTIKKGIGSLLRELSLDEFPQFLNVLKGDMSLVGTRPPTMDEWEQYELHHRARLAIKPGLTGMWQVSGRSDITDFEEVVKLDTKYISEWSIGLDLKILVKTVLVVFGKRGAM